MEPIDLRELQEHALLLLDTAPIIYFLEAHPQFAPRFKPLFDRHAASARGLCRRETAIVARLGNRALVECVADLAFSEAGEWIVVEFKTDGELGAHEQRYRRQLALYVGGISDATSLPARGQLMLL
jgi:ATP-dependent exoDNAse (exonuclease V) beta subunit